MSCRRKILSRPAMNETGEKIYTWRTPLSISNGSDIAIFQLGCLTRTTPVAAVQIAFIIRLTFEGTPASARASSRKSSLSVSKAAL